MTVFPTVLRKLVGTMMGLMCTRNPICTLTILMAVGTFALMLYALLWKMGNLVDLPDKHIGFYNFCLWNETARELQCLENKHLQVMGINLTIIGIAKVCVYVCLVFNIFYPFFMTHVMCIEEREGWKLILSILIIKVVMLSAGLGFFCYQTWEWIHTDFTGGFFALLGTLALLFLQILTIIAYLSWQSTHTSVKALLPRGPCSLWFDSEEDATAIDNLI